MNKTIFILLIFLLPTLGSAQVGIGTKNPQRELHVSGDTNATIRLEGLNETNNMRNDGVDLAPVFVAKNGNLTLEPSEDGYSPIKIINANTAFASQVLASNPLGTANTTTNIYIYNFTLLAPASIEIKYSMSYRVFESYSAGVGTRLFDGQSRQIRTFLPLMQTLTTMVK